MEHFLCKILIYFSGVVDKVQQGTRKKRGAFSEHPSRDSYNRIKSNFKWGLVNRAATTPVIKELEMMLNYYPRDSASSFFNADYMLSYPYNMEGKKCEDKYPRGRAIVIGKGGQDIFVYFFLTDEGADNFEKYLSEFRRTLWFED